MNHLNELVLANLFLVLVWLAYELFFSRLRLFQANRYFLLSGSLVAVLLPWLPWYIPIGQAARPVFQIPLIGAFETAPVEETASEALSSAGFTAAEWIVTVYFSIVAILFLLSAAQVIRLIRWSRSARSFRHKGFKIVPLERSCAAFSFFGTVYYPAPVKMETWETNTILEHEKVHIRQWHSLDNLLFTLLRIIFFYNPAVYFLTTRIRLVHEYIADEATVGVNTVEYSNALINHQFLVPGLLLMHSFNTKTLLKRRLTMLSKTKQSRRVGWSYLIVIPVLAAMILLNGWSATAQDQAKKSKEEIAKMAVEKELAKAGFSKADIEEIKLRIDGKTIKTPEKGTEIEEENQVFQIVDMMPEFEGGGIDKFRDWVQKHVKYPQEAKEKKLQGTVYVSFVVGRDGVVKWINLLRSVDPILDNEVLGVIKSSPAWKPGQQRNKPVNVSFSVPIKFVLGEK